MPTLPGNPLLQAALEYAGYGWRVIPLHNQIAEGRCTCQAYRDDHAMGPCPNPGKHPRMVDWQKRASNDARQVKAWWKVNPKANVGLVSGAESGLMVLDTDPRNGGIESREALVFQHGAIPYTTTAQTGGADSFGRRGTHEYFKWPTGLPQTKTVVEIAEGVEVLLDPHIVVAAPSLHPSGRCYEWEAELGPAEQQPVDAPAWLLDLLRSRLIEQPAAKPENRGGWPLADIGKILAGCGWMAHCSDHAATLSEPEWYAQLSVLGRCENGEKLAQELSRPHPGYHASATAAKLKHAVQDAGPATCAKIASSLGGSRFCDVCPNYGKVKSPVVLGIKTAPPKPEGPSLPRDPQDAHPVDAPEGTPVVEMPGDAERAVRLAIEGDDETVVIRLAPLLASVNATERGELKARLRKHFGKRISFKDLDAAIKQERGKYAAMQDEERVHWTTKLLRNANSTYQGNLANAITAFRHAPEWAGVLAWNDFAVCSVSRKKPPIAEGVGSWTNHHDVLACEWLQREGIEVSVQIAGLAVEAAAREQRFHPPREYLLSQKWDAVERLDTMLETYFGATIEQPPLLEGKQPRGYLATVGRKWMIGAVARILDPGCKMDYALIFEGEQGKGKSTALSILGGEWFTDQLEQMGSKDSSMQTHGVWIIEIAELQSMSKSENENVKAFISRQKERYRPPYAGRLVEIPRQCVFAGTVNSFDWNKDESGARRFWPVRCEKVDLLALRRDRDQLWAEARDRYDHDEHWWIEDPEIIRVAEREQADRLQEDAWTELVRSFLRFELAGRDVTVGLILTECLKVPIDRRSQTDANRVGRIFRAEGWRKSRLNSGGFRSHVYRPYTPAAIRAYVGQQSEMELAKK